MTETNEPIKVHRGLRGVYFDRSPCTFIDGKAGDLRYRGYSIHDLAEHSTFEETAWLLLHGELPTAAELAAFDADLRGARALPGAIIDVISAVASAHPMDVLRTAVSALSAFDPDAADNNRDAVLRKAVRLTSQVPVIVAAHARIRDGLEPVPGDPGLNHAGNLLWMLTGAKPSPRAVELVDRDLILHAEHGSNASSFAARVIIGTEAEPARRRRSGDRSALGARARRRGRGCDEDGRGDRRSCSRCGIRPSEAQGRRAGDRVRASRLSRRRSARAPHAGRRRAAVTGDGTAAMDDILQAVVTAMAPYARHGVNVNVDFYSGVVYHLLGIKRDLFVPIFAIGRVPGWVVQVLEQLDNNILIRPLTLYDGPQPRAYVPIDQRRGVPG